MEDLTKQQIVLLTLLVSFVTSIATGIFTVSLMDQAPKAITQTINRIVERTVEKVSTDDTGTASVFVSFEEQIPKAIDLASKSIVRFKQRGGDMNSVTGLGLIVTSNGVIVTDKASIASFENPVALFSTGEEYPVSIVQSQIDGDIVFLLASLPLEKRLKNAVPLTPVHNLKLGQTVLTLSGKDIGKLSQGVVEEMTTTDTDKIITTTISPESLMIGTPLFTLQGEIVGFKTSSRSETFYPFELLKKSIPTVVK